MHLKMIFVVISYDISKKQLNLASKNIFKLTIKTRNYFFFYKNHPSMNKLHKQYIFVDYDVQKMVCVCQGLHVNM